MASQSRRSVRCKSSTRVKTALLLAFLASAPIAARDSLPPSLLAPSTPANPVPAAHDFTLRHVFHRGTYQNPGLHKRLDVHPQETLWTTSDNESPRLSQYPHFEINSNARQIQRLADRRPHIVESYLQSARRTGDAVVLCASEWTLDDVNGPDIADKDTIINLAVMAADAYAPVIREGEWEDVGLGFNQSQPFGWQGDGLRGHIFADEGNSTIIISLKGTSPAVFDGDGTTTKDKLNDNLFFSCCCAQGGQYFWRQVCDCYSSTYTCNQTCLAKALQSENRYYRAAIDLYTNVTEIYPDSYVWLVGHSLGGSVSSLLGLTFGLPVVTFEAPGEALAAARLGLPVPPGSDPARPQDRKYSGVVHIGHTADPVFMGTCNGATATCTLGGYAMESQCHAGIQCVYDTVEDFGWRVGIGNHKIHAVIDTVIKKYDSVPKCVPDDECQDCFLWKYFDSNGSDSTTTTTTSSSTTTRTRTTTCKTPGWWGCLDESSTTTTTTSTSTSSETTSTCKTPGWFGCKDSSKDTTSTASPSQSVKPPSGSTETQSTTCVHPGWFGDCHESSKTKPGHGRTSHSSASSTTCQTPGFFGCWDGPSPSSSITTPPKTPLPTKTSTSSASSRTTSTDGCSKRIFFGLICWDQMGAVAREDANSGRPTTTTDFNSEL